jgi:hypothetical protein
VAEEIDTEIDNMRRRTYLEKTVGTLNHKIETGEAMLYSANLRIMKENISLLG